MEGSNYLLDSRKGTNGPTSVRTICETHREIYDLLVINLAQQNQEGFYQIKVLLEEAFRQGIKLVAHLCEYKIKSKELYTDWKKLTATEVQELALLRKERNRLLKILENPVLDKNN